MANRTVQSYRYIPRGSSALYFNGTNAYATCPITPSTSGFCFSFNITDMGSSNFSRCISWSDASVTQGFYIYKGGTNSLQFFVYNSSTQVNIVIPYKAGTPLNVTATFKTNECKVYANGVQTGSTDSSCTMANATGQVLTLGRRSDGASGYFKCAISEFCFENTDTPWTQDEVYDLVRRGIAPAGATMYSLNNTLSAIDGSSTLTATNTSYVTDPLLAARSVVGTSTPASLPSSISGLFLDLDSRKNVYSDAGTTPATNGQGVYQWNDQSGNGNNVSQATGGNQATYVTNVLNGIPGLLFSNANQSVMTCADNASLSPTTVHLYSVVVPSNWKLNSNQATIYKDVGGAITNGPYGLWVNTSTGAINTNVTGTNNVNGGVSGSNSVLAGVPLIMEGAFDSSSMIYAWKNGTLVGTAGPTSFAALADTDGNLRIGAQKATFPTRSFDGYILRILAFNRALSANEREAVNGYLSETYGINLSTKRGIILNRSTI